MPIIFRIASNIFSLFSKDDQQSLITPIVIDTSIANRHPKNIDVIAIADSILPIC